jgi:hypothetical protein
MGNDISSLSKEEEPFYPSFKTEKPKAETKSNVQPPSVAALKGNFLNH